MATPSDAQAVKSLNTAPGRRRFVFKTFSQRLEEIEIDVYKSLDRIKSEPSEGSSFFRDCLVEWRELNTTEDFISYYEEIMPLVQTLPLVLLHKEVIISKLLSRLQMKARLSLEPIIRLISALSRDLLEDFFLFLPRIVDSLVSLLENGADKETEIIEQIFCSWSSMMMYLQKYLRRDIVYVLKITTKLRYYVKEYVQDFMAEAMSFLLRNAPVEELIKGVRKLMFEVVKKQSVERKAGVSALLYYTMRGTSLKFHSKAERVLRILLDNSIFRIGDKFTEGADTIVEVIDAAFQRLCEALESKELTLLWNCLYQETIDAINSKNSSYLGRLLTLLISNVQFDEGRKVLDYGPLLELVTMLVQKLFVSHGSTVAEDGLVEVLDKVLKLMLCIVDGLHRANNSSALQHCCLQWTPLFELQNLSLLEFIGEMLLKDSSIVCAFHAIILRTLDNLIENSLEQVICLCLCLSEKMLVAVDIHGVLFGGHSRIQQFVQQTVTNWVSLIKGFRNGDRLSAQLDEAELALLWGVICCYPYAFDTPHCLALLMDLIDEIDQLIPAQDDKILGFARHTWQSLIGTAISSHHRLCCNTKAGFEDANKVVQLAKKHKASPQVLVAVADYLDSVHGSKLQEAYDTYHQEFEANKFVDAVDCFAENLCHFDKRIRVSTLRILSHYQPLSSDIYASDRPVGQKMSDEICQTSHGIGLGGNVLELLLSIETIPLSVSTSRKVILLISKIQMDLSAGRIGESYLPLLLYGIIGIFYNRFSYLWAPALECLAFLISKHAGTIWDIFIRYLRDCQLVFKASRDHVNEVTADLPDKSNGLVKRFHLFTSPVVDRTPIESVFSLLIQSLQKVPTIAEARSRQLVPLFLNFLGYSDHEHSSVGSFDSHACKGKQWKGILKEWLNLLKLMRNPKSFYWSQFLKEVLQNRLLDDNDPEIQMKVLECLLTWKDAFLLPYEQNLRNLIDSKSLREELTTWSLSLDSNMIEYSHRAYIVPLVIRILVPKVRNLKTLASRKHKSVYHRKAVLGFIAQLDVNELPLFFALLVKPFQVITMGSDGMQNWFVYSASSSMDDFLAFNFLKYFTTDNIAALSWKKRSGYLHVIEDILMTFDEHHINPFLQLLMGSVMRFLAFCTCRLDRGKSNQASNEDTGAGDNLLVGVESKQLKDLRSLCLKIVSSVLIKYEEHEFDGELWDLFFHSVKPLIEGFKQEGSSSEKPSSLFSCFLSMSRSHKLVSLLCREQSLVPDMFSMLSITTASEAILSGVLKFIENLLNLDSDLGEEDSCVREVLLPNVEELTCSLHSLFLGDSPIKRKLIKHPGESLIKVFKLLPKYVSNQSLGRKIMDVLLMFLSKGAQNPDVYREILHVIQDLLPVLSGTCDKEILVAVSPLLSWVELDMRVSICNLLAALAETDHSVAVVGKLINELNATSSMEIEGLDYDRITNAYEKISFDLFYSVEVDHALIILSQFVYDMSSDELILRHSAYRSLHAFIEFSTKIIDCETKGVEKTPEGMVVHDSSCWTKSSVERIVDKFLLKHLGGVMRKKASIRKEWMDLLRAMVLNLPELANLNSFNPLCSEDAEVDFFFNIVHLQKHRRARALSRFRSIISTSSMSEDILNKIFVPMFFNMLFDVEDGKIEQIKNACLEALASVAGHVEWRSYYALLIRCFRQMTTNPEKQKLLLRLICFILDQFHFSEVNFSRESIGPSETAPDTVKLDTASVTLRKCSSIEAMEIQDSLQKNVLPRIQKLLNCDSDKLNVNINLAALKLLKLLPGDTLDSQLPTIIHHIVNLLKSRAESTRDEGRSALAACLKELGLEYLQFILNVLRATLKRGYELHVLGYTLNFILSKFLVHPSRMKLDYCLEDLLSIVKSDILGDVSEEKEVEKIASKMKETRKRKSFDTLKLIAQNITFKSHALKLLSPVTSQLQKHLTPKLKVKLESMLSHVATGIESNPSVDQTDLLIFVYGLIEDGINKEMGQGDNLTVPSGEKYHKDNMSGNRVATSQLFQIDSQGSHMITVFGLGLLHARLKNSKMDRNDVNLLSMLDPFVVLLCSCLSSKYEDILSASLRCLTPLFRLPLPSFETQADKIKGALLDIAQSSVDSSSPLMQSCLKLLTVLLRMTNITLSSEELQTLIQFPIFVDLERNSSFLALSLLKAIISRKLVVPEIYDVVKQVGELMVTSQVDSIRKKCSQILLQFLLDYHLSEKRLQQHLDFLLSNLRYEHSSGREAVLEMLHAIIVKFPKSVLDEQSQSLFIHLVVSLANDQDNRVRSMTGAAIKLLVARISPHPLHSILEYSLSWYLGGKKQLWSAAAQVLGLLVEVMKKGFHKYISSILPVARSVLQSAISSVASDQLDLPDEAAIPFWKEAYYSLVMLEKILHQFQHLTFEAEFEDIWTAVSELLLHPHMWLRNISSRLLAFYFAAITDACRGNNEKQLGDFLLMRKSRLFLIAVSLCCQMKTQPADDAAGHLMIENIVFSMSCLNSLMGHVEPLAWKSFWLTLGQDEKLCFLKAFQLLDPRNGKAIFVSLTSGLEGHNDGHSGDGRYLLVHSLLKRLGKIALQMEHVQLKIVFDIFRKFSSQIGGEDAVHYAYQLLLPLYKVCEELTGKVISENSKQLAQEVSESLRSTLGLQNFVQVYGQIRKDLKHKRDKRKQDEKLMAVINPVRNAKRKLRMSARHSAHKKRKIMTMKMARWMH
ncbi:hypothetical protein ACJRO7_029686 [Eucalyptus globulus]|uniref:Small subunit processome component 20 homolog n=1 Tax=Eucalyptus globulus TaxID=34317 RepID=A0ABD3JB23_EUCGL